LQLLIGVEFRRLKSRATLVPNNSPGTPAPSRTVLALDRPLRLNYCNVMPRGQITGVARTESA